MNTQNAKKQLGYTLIELSIGLAITSIVMVGVVAGVQKIMEQVNLNRSVTQINTAVEKIKLIIKRDADTTYATLQNMTSTHNNAFATSNVTGAGTTSVQVFNALGNKMTMSSPSSNQFFRIYLENVAPSTCAELIGALEGATERIWIYNNAWRTLKDNQAGTVFKPSDARTWCLTSAKNDIIFEYLK